MKKTYSIIILTAYLAVSNFAFANQTNPLQALGELAEEIATSEVEFISLKLTHSQNELATLLKTSSICSKQKNYNQMESEDLASQIKMAFSKAYTMMLDQEIIDQDDGYYGKIETLQSAIHLFKMNEVKSQLTVCVEDTVPAYSDGHRLILVFKAERPLFAFEIGQPD